MAQSGYTPILIYASGTATNVPLAANMTSSASGAELALNYADGKLYFKNSAGVVTLLAGSGGGGPAAGSNTQVQYNNNGVFGGAANMLYTPSALSLNQNLLFTDNSYDIGASGATRPRSLFLGSNLNVAGTSLLTGNVGIGAANATSAKLQVADTARFSTYLATGSRILQLDYDASVTSSWSFGNFDQNITAITQDFAFSRYNGTSWSAVNVLRLRTGGNVSMNYNLSVATTDSNPWGTAGFRAVQLFDLTGGSFAGSGYAAYVSANTYNDGTNWLRVGASFAPSSYQQFDGSHIFNYAAAGAAGSTITYIKALETTKTGSVSIPAFLGVNATPNLNYTVRIGNDGAQIRLQRASAIRYRSDFQVTSAGLEINAFDDTGGVYLGFLSSFSNHTWNYGTSVQAAAATINTSGVFATTFDAYFNGVRVGRGGGNISNNTAVGVNALNGTATGIGNTAIGWGAGGNITSSTYNTAVGLNALGSATGAVTGADGSTAIGVNALFSLTSGNKNTAVGRDSGYTSTTGLGNVFLGYGAGFTNNSNGNVFIGFEAGKLYTGANSVFLGNLAGTIATTGNYNTFLGDETGYGHTTGGNNTFVGVGAGYGANTLTNTLIIGQYNGDNGKGAGELLTSGSNSTYVGGFSGNQNGLDTRGLSQQVVISDGAGYLAFHNNVSKTTTNPYGNLDVTFGSAGTTVNVLVASSGTAVGIVGDGNTFSGILIINDISTTGSTAMFIYGGIVTATKISESGGANYFQANNTTPTGNNTGVYMNGNAITLKQNSGGSISYRIIALRTRTSL